MSLVGSRLLAMDSLLKPVLAKNIREDKKEVLVASGGVLPCNVSYGHSGLRIPMVCSPFSFFSLIALGHEDYWKTSTTRVGVCALPPHLPMRFQTEDGKQGMPQCLSMTSWSTMYKTLTQEAQAMSSLSSLVLPRKPFFPALNIRRVTHGTRAPRVVPREVNCRTRLEHDHDVTDGI